MHYRTQLSVISSDLMHSHGLGLCDHIPCILGHSVHGRIWGKLLPDFSFVLFIFELHLSVFECFENHSDFMDVYLASAGYKCFKVTMKSLMKDHILMREHPTLLDNYEALFTPFHFSFFSLFFLGGYLKCQGSPVVL